MVLSFDRWVSKLCQNTDDKWKLENLKEIRSRMMGWQLDSFEKSYKFKCENGVSLKKLEKKSI